MSLPVNKKPATAGKSQKAAEQSSKFMKTSAKPSAPSKKVRSTGANRGS